MIRSKPVTVWSATVMPWSTPATSWSMRADLEHGRDAMEQTHDGIVQPSCDMAHASRDREQARTSPGSQAFASVGGASGSSFQQRPASAASSEFLRLDSTRTAEDAATLNKALSSPCAAIRTTVQHEALRRLGPVPVARSVLPVMAPHSSPQAWSSLPLRAGASGSDCSRT